MEPPLKRPVKDRADIEAASGRVTKMNEIPDPLNSFPVECHALHRLMQEVVDLRAKVASLKKVQSKERLRIELINLCQDGGELKPELAL